MKRLGCCLVRVSLDPNGHPALRMTFIFSTIVWYIGEVGAMAFGRLTSTIYILIGVCPLPEASPLEGVEWPPRPSSTTAGLFKRGNLCWANDLCSAGGSWLEEPVGWGR